MSLLRRITCIFTGCEMGAWLPTVSENPAMHSYLRHCCRCRRFEHRLRAASEGPPP